VGKKSLAPAAKNGKGMSTSRLRSVIPLKCAFIGHFRPGENARGNEQSYYPCNRGEEFQSLGIDPVASRSRAIQRFLLYFVMEFAAVAEMVWPSRFTADAVFMVTRIRHART